jgi:hypothetical protein
MRMKNCSKRYDPFWFPAKFLVQSAYLQAGTGRVHARED